MGMRVADTADLSVRTTLLRLYDGLVVVLTIVFVGLQEYHPRGVNIVIRHQADYLEPIESEKREERPVKGGRVQD